MTAYKFTWLNLTTRGGYRWYEKAAQWTGATNTGFPGAGWFHASSSPELAVVTTPAEDESTRILWRVDRLGELYDRHGLYLGSRGMRLVERVETPTIPLELARRYAERCKRVSGWPVQSVWEPGKAPSSVEMAERLALANDLRHIADLCHKGGQTVDFEGLLRRVMEEMQCATPT